MYKHYSVDKINSIFHIQIPFSYSLLQARRKGGRKDREIHIVLRPLRKYGLGPIPSKVQDQNKSVIFYIYHVIQPRIALNMPLPIRRSRHPSMIVSFMVILNIKTSNSVFILSSFICMLRYTNLKIMFCPMRKLVYDFQLRFFEKLEKCWQRVGHNLVYIA